MGCYSAGTLATLQMRKWLFREVNKLVLACNLLASISVTSHGFRFGV